jgi:hypothetical protein
VGVCSLRTFLATGDKESAGLRRSVEVHMYGRIVRIGFIIGVLILTGAPSALAEAPVISIDFSFVVGAKTLSAGNWAVDIADGCKVVLTHEKGGDPVEIPAIQPLNRKVERAEVVFDVVGSAMFLSEVLVPGKGGCQVNRHPGSQERQTVKAPKVKK